MIRASIKSKKRSVKLMDGRVKPVAGRADSRSVIRRSLPKAAQYASLLRPTTFRYLLILGRCAWKHSCHTFRIDVEGQECQRLAAWVPPLMHEGVGFIDQGTRSSFRRRAVDCVGARAGDYIVQSRSRPIVWRVGRHLRRKCDSC